jgi:hypothetical protein
MPNFFLSILRDHDWLLVILLLAVFTSLAAAVLRVCTENLIREQIRAS